MIRFEHVTRRYGPAGQPALDDVTVEFTRGEFAFLIGASGSGKSTLLRMILREGLPQRGRITVAGQNLGLMLERRVPEYRRSVGMVFQDFRLLPDKTVYDNVAFAMRVIGTRRSQIRKRVTKVLERVNLEHLAKRYPHEISGGEQQRAAIARAIVNEPAILLADEPTGNLDPRASAEVMKILRWINASGTTVIMSTHDRAIVDRMQRRVVQLHRGRLVRDGLRSSYDPPQGSEAWSILLEDEQDSGVWSPTDPTALGAEDAPERPSEAEHMERLSAQIDDGVASSGSSGSSSTAQSIAGKGRNASRKARRRQERTTHTGSAAAAEAPDGALEPSEKEQGRTASAQADESESATEEGGPDPEFTGIRVVWPVDGRQAAADSLPEPAGDFSGAELPDMDRDGFPEPELGEEPAEKSADILSGTAVEDVPSDDAAVRAAAAATPQSAQQPGEPPRPRMSWLAHAGKQPVNRTGEGTPGLESGSRAEDERLARQDVEDEPPVIVGAPELVGDGPQSGQIGPGGEHADRLDHNEVDRDQAHHEGDEDGGPAGQSPEARDSLPESEPKPAPRPRSSASQTSYTDTQRTAEQLGVGSKRSFLRRLRRDG